MKYAENGVPRRNRVDLRTPAETAIVEAMVEVERAGIDALLDEAILLLNRAREKVADFVDADPQPAAERKP